MPFRGRTEDTRAAWLRLNLEETGSGWKALLEEEGPFSRVVVPASPPTPVHPSVRVSQAPQSSRMPGSCHTTLHFWDAWDVCHSLLSLGSPGLSSLKVCTLSQSQHCHPSNAQLPLKDDLQGPAAPLLPPQNQNSNCKPMWRARKVQTLVLIKHPLQSRYHTTIIQCPFSHLIPKNTAR